MQIKKLLQEDDAVSPVIGVILMVAITVILAAVIASFVLGLGGSQTQNPQASFSWDYQSDQGSETDPESDSEPDGIVKISHDGGDTIPAAELYVRGDGLADIDNPKTNNPQITDRSQQWPKENATAEQGGQSAVSSGNSVGAIVDSNFDLNLVWQPEEGDTSATLTSETGPDA